MYEFKEYSLYQVNLIIDNPPLFTEKLTDEQKQMIMTNGNVVKIKDNIISVLYNDRFCYLPLLIRNVGTGCAINMNIGLRKVEANHKFQFVPYIDKNNVSAYRLYAPFTCNKDEKLTLRLITDNPKQNINGIYELFFEYKDIFNDCYKQSIKLVIENDYIIKVYYDYE